MLDPIPLISESDFGGMSSIKASFNDPFERRMVGLILVLSLETLSDIRTSF